MTKTVLDLPNGPAVYAFENIADGKLYIGSSVNVRAPELCERQAAAAKFKLQV